MVRASALPLVVLASMIALAGCQGVSKTRPREIPLPRPEIKSIRVLPETSTAVIGQSVELAAVGIGPAGEEIAISPEWQVQGLVMGLVSPAMGPAVVFTPKKNGVAFVEARQNGIRGAAKITVKAAKPAPAPAKSKKNGKK